MPGPADAGTATWLVLVYRLPARPAGLKATVHWKLTAAVAAYLSRACAAAPAGPAERVMRRMRATIADAGGWISATSPHARIRRQRSLPGKI